MSESMIAHVVWDWNGTLYADLDVTVAAVNEVMRALGATRTYVADDYRTHYQRPVKRFYESLAERSISEEEWEAINGVWHEHYLANHRASALTADAIAALDRVQAAEIGQSLLSMWTHDELVPLLAEYDLVGRFRRVDGLRGAPGGGKTPHLLQHLAELGISDPSTVVVIGDAIDDAIAARDVGAHAVLYDGGSHLRRELDAFSAPVVESLLEALDVAGVPAP